MKYAIYFFISTATFFLALEAAGDMIDSAQAAAESRETQIDLAMKK